MIELWATPKTSQTTVKRVVIYVLKFCRLKILTMAYSLAFKFISLVSLSLIPFQLDSLGNLSGGVALHFIKVRRA